MGTFEIKSSALNNSYEYKDSAVIVNGNYNIDNTTSELQNVSGNVYEKDAQGNQGRYIGNFNGYMNNEVLTYSLSAMSRADSNKVWDAIDGIEPNIIGTNEE